ncbi:hypothetical protein C8Q70DRAFT_1054437 [Cubamyces menziesii]|nr:hypothetical protein C8Q70DRAFT_1054437 [Cubamyces menziesii]
MRLVYKRKKIIKVARVQHPRRLAGRLQRIKQHLILTTIIGHAVYVYHIVLTAPISGVTTTTNLTFYIDNHLVGAYAHSTAQGSVPPVLYKVPVYSNDSLAQGEHTLQIITSGDSPAAVLFDYIEYTTEEDDPPSSTAASSQASGSSPTSQVGVSSPMAQTSGPSALNASSVAQAAHPPSSQGGGSSLASPAANTSSAAQHSPTSHVSWISVSSPIPQPDPTSSSTSQNRQQTHSSNVAAIAGAIAGGIVASAIACFLGVLWCSRARRQRRGAQDALPRNDTRLELDKDHTCERDCGYPFASFPLLRGESSRPRPIPPTSDSVRVAPESLEPPSELDTDYTQREKLLSSLSVGTAIAPVPAGRSVLLAQGKQVLLDHEDGLRHLRNDPFEGATRGSHNAHVDQHGRGAYFNNGTLEALRAEMSALRTILETQRPAMNISHDVPPAYVR